MGAWLTSMRRVAVPLVTFGLGALTKLDPSLGVEDYLFGGTVILALLCLEEYFTNVRPSVQLMEIAPLAMDTAAAPLIASLHPIKVRMSVFKAVRPARALWRRKYFKMMWNKNMEDHPDVNLSFPVDAGVSGDCFQKKSPRIADATGIASLPLPPKIASALGDTPLKAVACCPIYERKRRGRQSGRVIGVLNLDSFDQNAYASFMDPAKDISSNMRLLAGLASQIFR